MNNRNKNLGQNSRQVDRGNNNYQGSNSRRSDFNSLMRMDNFDSMFEGFGMPRFNMDKFFGSGFDDDDFGGDMFSGFSSITRGGMGNMPGTVITKSYVSKVNYDDNGRPQKETYQSQSIKQTDRDGKSIKEKQHAYENTKSGLQKAAHERRLNDKGIKVIREKNFQTGDEMEHNVYKGMNEGKRYLILDDLDNFNREYSDYRNKSKFEENYKYLNSLKAGRGLPQGNQRNNMDKNSRDMRALPGKR
jgi:hypothetical protein